VRRRSLALHPDPAEVSAYRWRTPAALRSEAQAAPSRFAPWFRIYLARWSELGLG
jgi:isopentenyldiphosphate isomerase